MSIASGWVRNCAGSAPAGFAGSAATAGGGGGASSFFPHAVRKVADAAILVIATNNFRCINALSCNGRVRGGGRYQKNGTGPWPGSHDSAGNEYVWGQPPFPGKR